MFVDVENLLLHFDLNVGDEFTFALTRILFGEGEEPPLKPREASNQATAISNVWGMSSLRVVFLRLLLDGGWPHEQRHPCII